MNEYEKVISLSKVALDKILSLRPGRTLEKKNWDLDDGESQRAQEF